MFRRPWAKNIFLTLINFARGRRTFFLGSTPFRRGGSPAPLRFPCFGAQGQGLFLLLLRRHRAAVAHGDSVLIVVFAHHAPVFELDVDGFAEVSLHFLSSAAAEDRLFSVFCSSEASEKSSFFIGFISNSRKFIGKKHVF